MASDSHRPLTEETLDRWHRYLCLQEGETDSHRLLDIAGQLLAEVRRLRSALSRKDPCDECDAENVRECDVCPVLHGVSRIRALQDEVEKTNRTLTLSNGTVVQAWDVSEVYPDRPVPNTEKGPER